MRSLLSKLPVPRAILAAAMLLLPFAALRADTVTAQFIGVNPGEVVSVSAGGTKYVGLEAGYFNWKYLSGATQFSPSFQSFCVELNRGVNNITTFTTAPLTPKFSDVQAARLQEFWGEHFAQIGQDARKAAAFQLGVWEIVNESGTTNLDLSSGNFTVLTSGRDATNAATVALSQSWLNDVNGSGSMESSLALLLSRDTQNQLTVTHPPTVPVPPAAILGGMGLVSLVGYGLRRRKLLAANPAK
ncbi:MAG: hypothetical protein ACJ8F7_19065 [Gemmataceae bacterium]